jgi:hypothetical protein
MWPAGIAQAWSVSPFPRSDGLQGAACRVSTVTVLWPSLRLGSQRTLWLFLAPGKSWRRFGHAWLARFTIG